MKRPDQLDSRAIAERAFRKAAAEMPRLRQAVQESDDPEAVHDLRVCIRRIRTGLRVFRPILRPTLLAQDEALHELFRSLGRVRDYDMAIAALQDEEQDGVLPLIERLNDRRADARTLLLDALANDDVFDRFVRSARRLATKSQAAIDAASIVEDARRKVKRSAKELRSEWSPAEAHRLRRRLKRLRYTVEFFEPALGQAAKAYIEKLKEPQDVIGSQMDRITMASILSALDRIDGPAADRRDEVVRHLNQEVDAHRVDLREADRRVGGKAWKRLRDALEG